MRGRSPKAGPGLILLGALALGCAAESGGSPEDASRLARDSQADTASPDADGALADAVVADAVVADAVVADAVVADAVVPDAVVPDAVVPDAVVADVGADRALDGGAVRDALADLGLLLDAESLPDAELPDAELQDAEPLVDVGPALDGSPDSEVPDAEVDAAPLPDAGEMPPPVQCAEIADQTLLDLVYQDGPKVPPGFYSDPPGVNPQWREPCAEALASTRQRAAETFANGVLTGAERSTDWFHEVEVRLAGGHLLQFRNHRCDYYDGRILAGVPHEAFEPLAFLAGYLWYAQYHNLHGAHFVGGNGAIGNAANFYALCHMQFVGGDFGLCDEISLHERRYRIGIFDGEVSVLDDPVLRRIQGRCN